RVALGCRDEVPVRFMEQVVGIALLAQVGDPRFWDFKRTAIHEQTMLELSESCVRRVLLGVQGKTELAAYFARGDLTLVSKKDQSESGICAQTFEVLEGSSASHERVEGGYQRPVNERYTVSYDVYLDRDGFAQQAIRERDAGGERRPARCRAPDGPIEAG